MLSAITVSYEVQLCVLRTQYCAIARLCSLREQYRAIARLCSLREQYQSKHDYVFFEHSIVL
jgi:hypothetical protein